MFLHNEGFSVKGQWITNLSNTWLNTQNDSSEEIWVHVIVKREQGWKEKKRSWERVCLAPGHRAGSWPDYPQSEYQGPGSASSFPSPSPIIFHICHPPTVFSGNWSFATSSALTSSASTPPPHPPVPPNWCGYMRLLNKTGRLELVLVPTLRPRIYALLQKD